MLTFALFCMPTIAYLVVRSRRPGHTFEAARRRVGLAWGKPSAYAWALLLLVPLLLVSWLSAALVPNDIVGTSGATIVRLTTLWSGVGIVFRAAGEEVFFRGLLGGVLVRRLGFWWGNTLQAVIFLLPHLPLLFIDLRLLPLLPVQFASGWLLGWLRNKTGTLLPGALVHAAINIIAGVLAA